MGSSDNESKIGSDAIVVETVIMAVLAVFIFSRGTQWQYFWVFKVAYVVALLIMLIRVMAGRAENPNVSRIQQTIRWSSTFLQLTIIGSLSVITLRFAELSDAFSAPAVLAITGFALYLMMFVVDEVLLGGEILDTWEKAIRRNADNELVRQFLLNVFEFAKDALRGELREGEIPNPKDRIKAMSIALFLLLMIFLISIPVLAILSHFFGDWGNAFLIVLSVFFVRDLSRSIYLNYGDSISFEDLNWNLRWEFVWFVIRGILLAGALGYTMRLPQFI